MRIRLRPRITLVVASLFLCPMLICSSAAQTNGFEDWVQQDRKNQKAWLTQHMDPTNAVVAPDMSSHSRERWLSESMVTPVTNRPLHWARPISGTGIENLYKVSDRLYRSAQPTAQGMKSLKAMGIKTVISLRAFHSDRDEIGDTGLEYERIMMKAWHLSRKDVVAFLKVVNDSKRVPVLVHCLRGSDRTGAMCAAYRIAMENWTQEEAIREMLQGGYSFHPAWENLPDKIRSLDFESIRRDAGIE